MPLHQRLGKFHPGALDGRTFGVVPAVLGVLQIIATGHDIQFDMADQIVKGTERLAVRPVIIPGGGIKEAFPGGKGVIGHAGIGGKPLKLGAVQKQCVSGLGHRKDHQLSVHRSVIQKFRHIARQLVLAEIRIPVQQLFGSQFSYGAGVAGEQIGHFRCAGFSGHCLLQLRCDLGAAGHIGDGHDDALLLTHRGIEFLHQPVHRGVGLFAIDMPQGQRDRLLRVKRRLFSAAGQTAQSEQCSKQKCDRSFHGFVPPSLGCVALSPKTNENQGNFQIFMLPSLPFGGLGRGQNRGNPYNDSRKGTSRRV